LKNGYDSDRIKVVSIQIGASNMKKGFSEILNFGKVKKRKVIANFNGGKITSDAGLLLIAEIDQKRQITKRFAACFQDYRDPNKTTHSIEELLAQRIYGLIQGYEDLIDHEQLRLDPIFNVVLGKNPEDILAGKSTLNRLEYKTSEIESEKSRYHKIKPIPEKIEQLIVELFLESYGKEPRQIVIDLDVTDIPVHGEQEGAFYNSYYDGICYAPLYLFCGYQILSAKLRSSNVDSAGGGLEEITRIVNLIRNKWKNTIIIIRGDRAYARDEIMDWCESRIASRIYNRNAKQ
jgi:hypothetical protein